MVEKLRVLLLVWVGPVFRVHKSLLAAKVLQTESIEGLWVGSLSWVMGAGARRTPTPGAGLPRTTGHRSLRLRTVS